MISLVWNLGGRTNEQRETKEKKASQGTDVLTIERKWIVARERWVGTCAEEVMGIRRALVMMSAGLCMELMHHYTTHLTLL